MPVRRPVDVSIREESIRLGQFLKLADLVEAGSDAKELIAAGDVLVNGEPETRRGRQLRVGDVVELNGRPARVARRPGPAALLADHHEPWRLPSAALEWRAGRGMRLDVHSNPPQVDIEERVAGPARLHVHSCRSKRPGKRADRLSPGR
jgi:ribosome-associated protein